VNNRKGFLNIVPVSDLLHNKYYIPAYQRGYRWTKDQVSELLDDISSFVPRNIGDLSEQTWYCLQPIIVRFDKDKNRYEVIDGQQRLTTIFLIIHYINEMWRGKDKDPEPTIDYESRPDSYEFLQKLQVDDGQINIDNFNIDYFHMFSAYQVIHSWTESSDFKKDQFINVFLNHVKVIWYETFEEDSIDVFTRINMGKIPLTNAELIKALFLNSSNFHDNDLEKVRLKQLEIAGDWDRIESHLHDSEFWYFLNNNERDYQTRIDLIFSILTDPDNKHDPYAVFREYSSNFMNHPEKMQKKWNEVKRCYQTLYEWFADKMLYHKIGYLLTFGDRSTLRGLFLKSQELTKSGFIEEINETIKNSLPHDLDSLQYGNSKIKRVLLFHNIQTMLKNSETRSRFPFDRYKQEKWDVEHIHSVHEEKPKSERHQRDWLRYSSKYIKDSSTLKRIEETLGADEWDPSVFETLFVDVLTDLAGPEKDSENKSGSQSYNEADNDISNLVLLDSETNRSYKNAVFPVKRNTIIEREKNGIFVPICTKNVFMKFYNPNVENFTFWNEEDKDTYLSDIKQCLCKEYGIGVGK